MVADISATIAGKADDLLSVSEKALEIDRLLERADSTAVVDPEPFVGDVIDPLLERYPDARIDVTLGVDELRTVPRLLSLALVETVENALEHADGTPEVTVRATREGDFVRFVVADDGPGIPAMEIETVRSGAETSLEHASSLGLWLIYWATQSLGGDVSFDAADDGSTVALRVPDIKPSADAAGEGGPISSSRSVSETDD